MNGRSRLRGERVAKKRSILKCHHCGKEAIQIEEMLSIVIRFFQHAEKRWLKAITEVSDRLPHIVESVNPCTCLHPHTLHFDERGCHSSGCECRAWWDGKKWQGVYEAVSRRNHVIGRSKK
jgi:hypothetical protein